MDDTFKNCLSGWINNGDSVTNKQKCKLLALLKRNINFVTKPKKKKNCETTVNIWEKNVC